jgi:activator of HSP90 ATPase
MNRFTVSKELSASSQGVYDEWLNSEQHSEMTQAPASASTEVAGIFTAHDGYINDINIELENGRRILQMWRTSEFERTDPDSSIEITLEKLPDGTLLTLKHWNIPDGQAEGFESGWQDFYFTPMQEYFSNQSKP